MTGPDAIHDAQKLLADLRDHLARHDKPIAFFFGAGTSCAVQVPETGDDTATKPLIPDVAGLTRLCKEDAAALDEKYAKAWTAIEDQCKAAKQYPNIENILSRLRMMLGAIGASDTLAGLKAAELVKLEETVRQTIARIVAPDKSRIPDELPHRKFARWLVKTARQHPVEIFTVNYDILIELALEAERIPIFDGFVGSYQPFFHPDSLRRTELAPSVNWTRLWKMHGSVTWRRVDRDGRLRVIRGEPDLSGEMIFPSFQKYDESRQQPYAAFMDRLARFLELDDALLIVSGFGFGDEHINNVIFGALENRPRTHVYALQYGEQGDDADLAKRSYQRRNMIVVGPDTGIIGGRRARWGLAEGHTFVEAAFEVTTKQQESQGGSNAAGTQMDSGRMKIGDFACFCDFLASMTSG